MNNLKIKKSLIPYLSLAAIMVASASFSSASFASDITHSVRSNAEQADSSANYFEIGIMYAIGYGPSFGEDGEWSNTDPVINGSYTWNNFFIESYSESGNGMAVGYNAFSNDNWSFDFTVTTDWFQYNYDNDGRYALLNHEEDLNELTIGGRLTGYIGNNIVQFAINQDATGENNGTTISALIGRSWQVRNWNFHGIIGAEYASAKLNDYYIGVSPEKASYYTGLDAYEAGASVSFSTEFGVTYPITEDWVFRATGRIATIPNEVTDSPYYVNKDSVATSFRTSLSYVF
ncbi:MAG: MipA/OmpV family protein [Colwellia sp.]|nr:MipA/OmpV family protein [Colwellia sp.]NQZ81399.1 MipA/OmpV family protein [Colwellia sp.]